MCVKEFFGYKCGHCSIPHLVQCPLTQSNTVYPICEYPAERPLFTDDYCHPCSRVLWNVQVLKDEEEHRKRHKTGHCTCEVVFDMEDRERRQRPRSKGKGKAKEYDQCEAHVTGSRQDFGGEIGTKFLDYQGMDSIRYDIGGSAYATRRSRPTLTGNGYGIGAGVYGIDEHGYPQFLGEGNGFAPRTKPGAFAPQGGPSDFNAPAVCSPGTTNQEMADDMTSEVTRQSWLPETKMEAYQYVGFHVDGGCHGHDCQEKFFSAESGHTHNATSPTSGPSKIGVVRTGMRWYPESEHNMLALPPVPTQLRLAYRQTLNRSINTEVPTISQKAASEPANFDEYYSESSVGGYGTGVGEDKSITSKQPMVVSSSMGRGRNYACKREEVSLSDGHLCE